MQHICITLREFPERTEAAVEEFKKVNIDPVLFDGWYGQKCNLTPGNSQYTTKAFTPGKVGITLSMVSLWKALQSFSNDSYWAIYEDDVVFNDPTNFQSDVERLLIEAPKGWDIIYMNHNCKLLDKLSPSIYSGKEFWCTHAYIINRRALLTCIDICENFWFCSDSQLRRAHLDQRLNSYVAAKELAGQRTRLFEWDSLTN